MNQLVDLELHYLFGSSFQNEPRDEACDWLLGNNGDKVGEESTNVGFVFGDSSTHNFSENVLDDHTGNDNNPANINPIGDLAHENNGDIDDDNVSVVSDNTYYSLESDDDFSDKSSDFSEADENVEVEAEDFSDYLCEFYFRFKVSHNGLNFLLKGFRKFNIQIPKIYET